MPVAYAAIGPDIVRIASGKVLVNPSMGSATVTDSLARMLESYVEITGLRSARVSYLEDALRLIADCVPHTHDQPNYGGNCVPCFARHKLESHPNGLRSRTPAEAPLKNSDVVRGPSTERET